MQPNSLSATKTWLPLQLLFFSTRSKASILKLTFHVLWSSCKYHPAERHNLLQLGEHYQWTSNQNKTKSAYKYIKYVHSMPMLSAVQEFNGGWLGSLTASFVRWWLVWCVGGGGVLVVVVKWCLVVPVTAKQPTPAGQMQPRQSHLGKKVSTDYEVWFKPQWSHIDTQSTAMWGVLLLYILTQGESNQ